MKHTLLNKWIFPAGVPVALILLWQCAFTFAWIDVNQWVSPLAVVQYVLTRCADIEFWVGIFFSIARLLAGLAFGGVAGVIVGIVMARSRWVSLAVEPTFNTLRQISLFAWVPLLSVYLGYGELSKWVFIALASFFPIALNTLAGVRGIDPKLFEAARIYHLPSHVYWFRFILPAASPQIFVGLQLGLIYAWLGVIGAEFLLRNYATHGIADSLINGRAAYLVDQIIAGTLIIGIVGVLLNALLVRIEFYALDFLPRAQQGASL